MTLKSRSSLFILITFLSLALTACVVEGKLPRFSLSANPTTLELSQGSSTDIQLSIAAISGFSDEVRFELLGLPEGVTGEFSLNPANTETTLTLTASDVAMVGKLDLKVQGQALSTSAPQIETLSLAITLTEGTNSANGEIIIPDTTVVISESAQVALKKVSEGSLSFATGSPLIDAIEVGDVLVGEFSALAPEGFLRKVLEIKTEANQLVFLTQEASLPDAITKGSLRAHIELKPEDVISTTSHLPSFSSQAFQDGFSKSFDNVIIFDKDDNETTTNDQIRASGLFEIKPVLDVAIDFGAPLDLFELHVGLEQHAELEITAEFEDTLKKEIKLFTHKFKPYVFTLGAVPIYIQPSLTVSLGIDGEIKAVATFTAEQDAELIAGFNYTDAAGFKNDSSRDFSFSNTDADFTGQLKLKAYTTANLKVTVNYLAEAFGKATASLKIDGKIPRDPIWILEGCFELSAGFKLDLLFFDALDFEKSLLELCKEIGRADNTPPEVQIINPKQGSTIDLGLETNLDAKGLDAEDGTTIFCCDYKWESNREGILATGPGARVAFRELGEHEITVTITDSKGVSSTDKVTVNVVNTAPRVEIIKPLANTTVFRNTTVIFQAKAVDINEPDAKLPCTQLVWTSSILKDGLPKSGCEIELSFASNGTRTIVLTGTDSQGATGTAKVTVNVVDPPVNLPPVVKITSPASGANISINDALNLSGTATDPEGDTPLSFEWTASLNSGIPIVLGSTASLTWTPSDSFDFSQEGSYTLQLRLNVKDIKGNTGSDFKVFVFSIIN